MTDPTAPLTVARLLGRPESLPPHLEWVRPDRPLRLHARCHPDAGLRADVRPDGVLHLTCAECAGFAADIGIREK